MTGLEGLPDDLVGSIAELADNAESLCLVSRRFAKVLRPEKQLFLLLHALLENLPERFEWILDHGYRIEYRDAKIMRQTVQAGQTVYVKMLLDRGADLSYDGVDPQGTYVHQAAYYGHAEALKLLIDAGCDFRAVEPRKKRTALYFAADKGWAEIVDLLVNAYGGKPLEQPDPILPLVVGGAGGGSSKIVGRLLDSGIDPLLKDKKNQSTGVHMISEYGFRYPPAENETIINMLIDAGVDIEATTVNGERAIAMAVRNGNFAAFNALCRAKADLKCRNRSGETLLHLAAYRGDAMICQSLLNSGLDINALDDFGRSPIRTALYNSEAARTIQFLIAAGADALGKNRAGDSLLHDAAWLGDMESTLVLRNVGVDINSLNDKGMTPVHCAVLNRSRPVVQRYLLWEADICIKDKWGKTPLALALWQKDDGMADIIKQSAAYRGLEAKGEAEKAMGDTSIVLQGNEYVAR